MTSKNDAGIGPHERLASQLGPELEARNVTSGPWADPERGPGREQRRPRGRHATQPTPSRPVISDATLAQIDRVAELGRGGRKTLGQLSREAKLAEQVNPGLVTYVAVVSDIDGANCEIAADYNTVKIGPYRFSRDHMPELWAAIGEAAWAAGVIERKMKEGDY